MTGELVRYADTYRADKALFRLVGGRFRFYGPDGSLAFVVKQKAFRLKEEITVYGPDGETPALRIKARAVLDIAATYDVTDVTTGQVVGALRRKGVKSIFRDEWEVLDTDGEVIGKVREDTGFLALLRRLILKFLPQTYRVTMDGRHAGTIAQSWNPFRLRYRVDFSADKDGLLDRRLGVAMVVLLLAIEGRQD